MARDAQVVVEQPHGPAAHEPRRNARDGGAEDDVLEGGDALPVAEVLEELARVAVRRGHGAERAGVGQVVVDALAQPLQLRGGEQVLDQHGAMRLVGAHRGVVHDGDGVGAARAARGIGSGRIAAAQRTSRPHVLEGRREPALRAAFHRWQWQGAARWRVAIHCRHCTRRVESVEYGPCTDQQLGD